jgi:hypothetical protein
MAGNQIRPSRELMRRRIEARKKNPIDPVRTYCTVIDGQKVTVKVMPAAWCEGYMRWPPYSKALTGGQKK